MKYTTDAYLITCLTNMHVGSGGANYGVVDNLVQRDSITKVPTINSSSLKGALREFFKDKWGECDNKLAYIFGPGDLRNVKEGNKDEKGNICKKEQGIGHYKFFNADLLVLPVRSNKKPFFRATAQMLIETIKTKAGAFNNSLVLNNYENDNKDNPKIKEGNAKLEDWDAIADNKILNDKTKLGDDIAVFHNDTFKILAKKLPVIARNQLENGESKNLWYEEIVPRESRFVFFVSRTETHKTDFEDILNGATVQVGANGSIGYGYCKITKIS